jgi:hypothetical protein
LLLPASGKWSEFVAVAGYMSPAEFETEGAETWYLLVFDQYGISGYEYDLTFAVTDPPPPPIPENEPNDSCAEANVVASLPHTAGGSQSSTNDQDWFEVTVTEDEVGMRFRVRVEASDPYYGVDSKVDVVSDDCSTSLGGPSQDLSYDEDFTSAAIPEAGTYYVNVYHSPDDPGGYSLGDYNAIIELVP